MQESNDEARKKKPRIEKVNESLPPLSSFPVHLKVIDPAVADAIRKAFASQTVEDADAARESTMPYMMSDFATIQIYNDAYATAQLIYAEALLLQESVSEDIIRESLRAVDLALLRGGVDKWGAITKNVVVKAERMLEVIDHTCKVTDSWSTQHGDELPSQYLTNPLCRSIPRIDGATLTYDQFLETYMLSPAGASPVIITNAMSAWPAMEKWRDPSYLKRKAASRLVPVETYSEQDATQTYLSDSWEQRVMSLGAFIEKYIEGSDSSDGDGGEGGQGGRGYLAQHQLFDQIPSLRDDIVTPPYCHALTATDKAAPALSYGGQTRTGSDPLVSAWLGPAGTVSPLHNDPYNNILAQVVGRKYLRLYDCRDTAAVYPREGCQCNNSFVDVDQVDVEAFPLFSAAPSWQCILESGEMLFIPRHWWHYVRSLDISFSVSFWFGAKMGLIKNPSTGEYESSHF